MWDYTIYCPNRDPEGGRGLHRAAVRRACLGEAGRVVTDGRARRRTALLWQEGGLCGPKARGLAPGPAQQQHTAGVGRTEGT